MIVPRQVSLGRKSFLTNGTQVRPRLFIQWTLSVIFSTAAFYYE